MLMAEEHSLGRRYAPDSRDRQYPMRLRLDPLREQFFPRGIPPGNRHYTPLPKVLHQGETGTCVAHAWSSRIEGPPIRQRVGHTPFELYRQIIGVDEWIDNDGEIHGPDDALQHGTSVRAGAKMCQQLGLLTNYLWAQSAEDIRAWHLANFGGVVLGINWRSGMWEPDAQGFIRYTGTYEGGHAIVSTGWNDRVQYGRTPVQAVRLQNSWGNAWGQSGRCWMPMEDLEQAVAEDGEACAPVEIRVGG